MERKEGGWRRSEGGSRRRVLFVLLYFLPWFAFAQGFRLDLSFSSFHLYFSLLDFSLSLLPVPLTLSLFNRFVYAFIHSRS